MTILLWTEIGFAWFLAVVYSCRPDSLAALTILPAWAWMLVALPGFLFIRRSRILGGLFVLSWLLFTVWHVEEPRAIIRGWMFPVRESTCSDALRLITLNCGGGQAAALAELKPFNPDIIFLQEPPPRSDVVAFLRDLYGDEGSLLYNLDTAILIRGALEDVRGDSSRVFYSHAAAVLPGGGSVHLVSLRLATGHVQINLWNPSCWDTHRRHRQHQLSQIREIVVDLPPSSALIVAGDFNAPAGDRIFSLLPFGMSDTFAVAGKGLGNTILNELPVLRIDQI